MKKKISHSFCLLLIVSISFSQNDETWELLSDAPLITTQNAPEISSFKNNPESIITYFFASKIRQDNSWREVLPEEKNWTKRLRYKVKKYENWTIKEFQLRKKNEYEKDKMWVEIFMKIEYQGKIESGTDEVELEKINGKWVITSIPT